MWWAIGYLVGSVITTEVYIATKKKRNEPARHSGVLSAMFFWPIVWSIAIYLSIKES